MKYDDFLATIKTLTCSQQENALKEVIELHEPHEITLPDGSFGLNCDECDGWVYPCSTIEAVKQGMRA
jgi:hypothetical protein